MSCGNPHATFCEEILDHVYDYLDGEMDAEDEVRFRQHLDECGPCLREYGLEAAVKFLVRRCCGSDPVPADLRDKVLVKIAQVRVEVRYQN